MTAKEIAQELGMKPDAIGSRLRRAHKAGFIAKFGLNDELPESIAQRLIEGKTLSSNQEGIAPKATNKPEANQEIKELEKKILILQANEETLLKELDQDRSIIAKFKETIDEQIVKLATNEDELEKLKNLIKQLTEQRDHANAMLKEKTTGLKRTWMATIALPLLAFPAAFCVYLFAREFVHEWIAIGEALAFEATYIGLAMIKNMTPEQRKLAKRTTLGAVFVSVLYSTIAAQLHQDPELIKQLTGAWSWVASAIYGLPLAIIAYALSNLLFHE